MVKSKATGGLGFKKFQDINMALLSKLGWMMASGDDRLWVSVLRNKYLAGRSFFSGVAKQGDSGVWKGILSTKEIVRKGSCYKVGSGWAVEVWHDPWIPGTTRRCPSPIDEEEPSLKVASLLEANKSWNISRIDSLFSREEAAKIRELARPHVDCEDKLCWTATSDGRFTVSSCYDLITATDGELEVDIVWRLIWHSGLHERLKMFLWRVAANVLPVSTVVARRLGGRSASCVLCGQEDEDLMHIFKFCPVTRALAFASIWSFRMDLFSGDNTRDLIANIVSKADSVEEFNLMVAKVSVLYSMWMFRNEVLFNGQREMTSALRKCHDVVEEFSRTSSNGIKPRSKEKQWGWTLPSVGRLVVNVDASTADGRSAAAMIVRDDRGRLVHVATCCDFNDKPLLAETRALLWATTVAEKKGWVAVDWRTDAQVVVRQVNTVADPVCWETRFEIMAMQQRFKDIPEWKLAWCPRLSNKSADFMAKWARINNRDIDLEYNFCCSLPSDFFKLLSMERASAAHSL